MTPNAWLTGHGRLPWERVHDLLSGTTCAWADLDGFHASPPPQTTPITTHLWAWSHDRLWRVRVAGHQAIAGELTFTPASGAEPVSVTQRRTSSWPGGENRVSIDAAWRDLDVLLYEVAGLMPITFVRLLQTPA